MIAVGRAGRGGDHLVGRRRHRPGPLRLGLRLVEGGHQLLHRGPGPPVRRPEDQAAGGGLLPLGWTARDRAVGGPAQPAGRAGPGPTAPAGAGHDVRRVQGGAGRRRAPDRHRRPRRARAGSPSRGSRTGSSSSATTSTGPAACSTPGPTPSPRASCRRPPSTGWPDWHAPGPDQHGRAGGPDDHRAGTGPPVHRDLGRRPRRRRHPRLPALPGRRAGTTSSTPGPPPTSTRSPTCWRRPPTAAGTRTGAWPRTMPTGSPPRCCSPTPCRPSSRRGAWWRSRPTRPTTSAGGPGSRPTTAGWPTSAPGRRAAGPAWPRSSPTTSRTPWPRCGGPPRTFRPFGGILLPSLPPGSGLPRLWDPAYEPLWDAVRGARRAWSTSTAAAGIPDYGDAEVARAIMLVELPWFSHRSVWHLIFGGVLERHPGSQGGADRAGAGLAAPGPRDPRLVLRPHDPRRRGRGQLLRCRGQGHVDDPVGVLRPQLLGGGELPAGQRIGRAPRGGGGADHVGGRLPPLRGHATPTAARRSGPPSATATRPRRSRCSRPTRPQLYGFDLEALRADRRPDRADRGRGGHAARRRASTRPTRPATPSTATRCCAPGRSPGRLSGQVRVSPEAAARTRPSTTGPRPVRRVAAQGGVLAQRLRRGADLVGDRRELVEVEPVDLGRGQPEQLGGVVHRHLGEVGPQPGRGVGPGALGVGVVGPPHDHVGPDDVPAADLLLRHGGGPDEDVGAEVVRRAAWRSCPAAGRPASWWCGRRPCTGPTSTSCRGPSRRRPR